MRTTINDRRRDAEICRWVADKVEPSYHPGDVGIAVEKDGRLLAGVLMNDFNGSNVYAHLRVDGPFGMTRGFLREVFRHAFETMGAARLTAPCVQSNVKIQILLAKMGFRCEAILKDFCREGHMYVMVMWPNNCKYLESNHG